MVGIPYPNGLAACMARVGVTDPSLAVAVGTTKQQIHKLRHGERKLTVQWAKQLAPFLDCTWQEVIEGPLGPADPLQVALLAEFKVMDQRDRETLVRIAKSMRREEPPAAPIQPKERAPPSHPTSGGSVAKSAGRKGCEKVVALRPGAV